MGLRGWLPVPSGPVCPRGQRPGPWWARPCLRRSGDDVAVYGRAAGRDHSGRDGRGLEALDDQIDAERELPEEDRDDEDQGHGGDPVDDAEHREDDGGELQGGSDAVSYTHLTLPTIYSV